MRSPRFSPFTSATAKLPRRSSSSSSLSLTIEPRSLFSRHFVDLATEKRSFSGKTAPIISDSRGPSNTRAIGTMSLQMTTRQREANHPETYSCFLVHLCDSICTSQTRNLLHRLSSSKIDSAPIQILIRTNLSRARKLLNFASRHGCDLEDSRVNDHRSPRSVGKRGSLSLSSRRFQSDGHPLETRRVNLILGKSDIHDYRYRVEKRGEGGG